MNTQIRACGATKRVTLLVAAAFVAVVLALVIPLKAWAAPNTSWYDGHETDSAYTLTNLLDLQGLAELVNTGTSFEGKTLTFDGGALGQNVRMTGEWTPIGTAANPFKGSFDGNGLNVTGFQVSATTDGVGLFGYVEGNISNVRVQGNITLENAQSIVRYVGGVAGQVTGNIDNCESAVNIKITTSLPATTEERLPIHHVAVVAGRVIGNVTDCSAAATGGINITSYSQVADTEVDWVVGFVAGIVGQHGTSIKNQDGLEEESVEGIENPGTIINCSNAANIYMVVPVDGPNDRFGEPTKVSAQFVAGIAGYSCGSIKYCTNSGIIDTGKYDDDDTAHERPTVGYGASLVAGIVGGWRTGVSISTAGDSDDPGLRYNKKTEGGTANIVLSDCTNKGRIIGLGTVGGIVGQAGSYSLLTRCDNWGYVGATRWNKPIPAGVAGRSYGTISYCYNAGDVETISGGGYYAAGIVGMLHSIGKDYNNNVLESECYACYNAGYIIASDSSFRSGSIVGELDGGYIHHCWSLSGRSVRDNVSGLDAPPSGIIDANTVYQIPEEEACSASRLAVLNALCATDGWQAYFTAPEDNNFTTPRKIPVLVSAPVDSATDISGATSAQIQLLEDAPYSAATDPAPTVRVTIGGTTLTQNVDFKVYGQAGTAGANMGDTVYQATIEGIGHYTGTLPVTASYKIVQSDISACTVTAEAKYFNWEQQKPDKVTVYDAAGNVVDESQYTWDVDAEEWAKGKYVNAQTKTAATGYPIVVTAAEGSNYKGSQTANVFKIKQVSFVYSHQSDNPNADTLLVGDLAWTDPVTGMKQTWKFTDVSAYSANGGKGDEETRGALKVKYTGDPIKPTIDVVTYMGRPLQQIFEGSPWWNDPYAYGYKVLYGNPNPESDKNPTDSFDDSVINVTGTDYAVITLRSAPNSNYDNYVMVWFEITPASISDDAVMIGFHSVATQAAQPDVKFTYNKRTLVEGTDYTVEYVSLGGNRYKAVYTGMGNYAGTLEKEFTVGAPATLFADVSDPSAWYFETVYDSVNRGLFSGYTDASGNPTGLFGPNDKLARGQITTVLYRAEGEPDYTPSKEFPDVTDPNA
ncbi:MAG: S-layer homology domain-containing protein, partial [Coriobacteriia bacterium]|nr:S-layer homology domain-containing protein [Coriobacteriia bacterium]